MLTRTFLTIAVIVAVGLSSSARPSSEIPGVPWKYHVIDSGLGADGARVLDVNGDGLPDIVTGWERGGRTRAYLNPGPAASAKPWPHVTVGTTGDVEDAVFADIDGDGAYDVVSASEGTTCALYIQFAPPVRADYLTSSAWTQVNLNGAANAPVRNQYMFSVIDDTSTGTASRISFTPPKARLASNRASSGCRTGRTPPIRTTGRCTGSPARTARNTTWRRLPI